jgi:hypothetical protein
LKSVDKSGERTLQWLSTTEGGQKSLGSVPAKTIDFAMSAYGPSGLTKN